jgi:hypothetical protein
MPRSGGDRWFSTKHETSPQGTYLDPSDAKALTTQAVIDFYHKGTKNSIAFKAFITGYSDSFTIRYADSIAENEQALYDGKLDEPESTLREISLSWKTVAASQAEAKANMQRVSELAQMLYNGIGSSEAIGDAKAGKVKVRFAQWIVDPAMVDPTNPGQFAPADSTGLNCRMAGLSYEPDLEQGSFDGPSGIFPKVINITTTLIHQPMTGDTPVSIKRGSREHPAISSRTIAGDKKARGTPFGYTGLETTRSDAPPPVSEINNADTTNDEYDAFVQDSLLQGGE